MSRPWRSPGNPRRAQRSGSPWERRSKGAAAGFAARRNRRQADFLAKKQEALSAVAAAFHLELADPWGPVKTLQRAFDPSALTFSPEYYDVLGLVPPAGG